MTNLGWQGFKDGVWKDTIKLKILLEIIILNIKATKVFLCDRSEKLMLYIK